MPQIADKTENLAILAKKIKAWGAQLGFQQVAIVEPDLSAASEKLHQWLASEYHGPQITHAIEFIDNFCELLTHVDGKCVKFLGVVQHNLLDAA